MIVICMILSSVLLAPIVSLVMDKLFSFIYNIMEKLFGYKVTDFIFTKLTIVGIIHHELSHLVLGLLLGCRLLDRKLYNKSSNSSKYLGYIDFQMSDNIVINSIQCYLVPSAPFVFGVFSLLSLSYILISFDLIVFVSILIKIVMISIFLHMFMSVPDINVMLDSPVYNLCNVVLPIFYTVLCIVFN